MNLWNLCDSCKKFDGCKMANPGRTFEVCWDHNPITRADLSAKHTESERFRALLIEITEDLECLVGDDELSSILPKTIQSAKEFCIRSHDALGQNDDPATAHPPTRGCHCHACLDSIPNNIDGTPRNGGAK